MLKIKDTINIAIFNRLASTFSVSAPIFSRIFAFELSNVDTSCSDSSGMDSERVLRNQVTKNVVI